LQRCEPLSALSYAALLSFTAVPIAMGFAVLRYRLYNIDLLINRTLVYGGLTATLTLIYFGGVATTQTIFRVLTGQQEQPQLAIMVSTLVIAALFNPLRRRIQACIDRRFHRRKYDAAKTLEAFSAKLRDKTDLDALSDDLVRETMQPAHVSLWLRPETPPRGDERADLQPFFTEAPGPELSEHLGHASLSNVLYPAQATSEDGPWVTIW
jgi:hypothetical protein